MTMIIIVIILIRPPCCTRLSRQQCLWSTIAYTRTYTRLMRRSKRKTINCLKLVIRTPHVDVLYVCHMGINQLIDGSMTHCERREGTKKREVYDDDEWSMSMLVHWLSFSLALSRFTRKFIHRKIKRFSSIDLSLNRRLVSNSHFALSLSALAISIASQYPTKGYILDRHTQIALRGDRPLAILQFVHQSNINIYPWMISQVYQYVPSRRRRRWVYREKIMILICREYNHARFCVAIVFIEKKQCDLTTHSQNDLVQSKLFCADKQNVNTWRERAKRDDQGFEETNPYRELSDGVGKSSLIRISVVF